MAIRRIDTQTLTDIADAVRAKTGGSSAMTPAEMVTAIGSISGGGGTPTRSKWFRPPDMPDYDSLADKSIFEWDENGAAYQANFFLTVSTRTPGKTTFDFRTYVFGTNDKVEYGIIENGAFSKLGDIPHVASGTNSFDLSTLSQDYPFIVIHFVRNNGTPPRWSFASAVGQTPPCVQSPVVEFYGMVYPSLNLFGVEDSPIQFYSIQYVSVYSPEVNSGSPAGGYQFKPPSIEIMDCTNAEKFAYSNHFQNAYSLAELMLPGSIELTFGLPNLFQNNYRLCEINLANATGFRSTTMRAWFSNCYSLKTLNLSGIDMSAVTNTQDMFSNCVNLQNLILTGATLPGVSFSLSASTLLTVDSLVAVIAALPTVTSATLTIGTTNKNKLTTEQIAVATGKGWTVA